MTEKILVVEDEPRVVRLVSTVLGAVGYKVVAAASGASAEAGKTRPPKATAHFPPGRLFRTCTFTYWPVFSAEPRS